MSEYLSDKIVVTLEQSENYLFLASKIANNSTSSKRKVGAIVVDFGKDSEKSVGHGFNGILPSWNGDKKTCEDSDNVTYAHVMHAELYALKRALMTPLSKEKLRVLYVTSIPCIECSRLTILSGVKFVVIDKDSSLLSERSKYRKSINFLRNHGVKVLFSSKK